MSALASASAFIPDFATEVTLCDGDAATTDTTLEEGRFIRRPRAFWDDARMPDYVCEVVVTEAFDAPGVAYALQVVIANNPGLVNGTTVLSLGISRGYEGAFKTLIAGRLLEIVPQDEDLYVGARRVVSGEGGALKLSARLSEAR